MALPKLSKTVKKVDPSDTDISRGPENAEPDLVTKFKTLSPTSQSSLLVLIQNLDKREVTLKEDKDGKQFIEYRQKKIANKIVKPKSDADVQSKVDACLELIDYVKIEIRLPSGVFLDRSKDSRRMALPKLSKTVKKVDPSDTDISRGPENAEPDLVTKFKTLSPTSQSSLLVLIQNLDKREVTLKEDKDGKQFIEYRQKKIANKIVKPKSDADVQSKVDAFLELIDYVKIERRLPSGVFLDRSKIHVEDGQYHESDEDFGFTRTKEILGSGFFVVIIVVKDNKTKQDHVLKTIKISVFRKEEILCWVDLEGTGHIPSLYLFQMKGDMVEIHMEIIREAHTMQSIIDKHLGKLDKSLLKPFSLYVLDGALEAASTLHGKNWVHKDLHEGNMMLQKSEGKIQLKIIDFGRASKYRDPVSGIDYRGFRSDIRNILGMYCSIYSKSKISNFHTTKWDDEIENQLLEMSKDDKDEVLYLVKLAMDVVYPEDVGEYRLKVQKKLDRALKEINKTKEEFLKEVEIWFPKT